MTAIATFIPQTWVNDSQVEVDPQGKVEFDITPEIESMGKEYALAIKDNSNASDVFQFAAHAPAWVKHWSGPFIIRLSESVAQHFESEQCAA